VLTQFNAPPLKKNRYEITTDAPAWADAEKSLRRAGLSGSKTVAVRSEAKAGKRKAGDETAAEVLEKVYSTDKGTGAKKGKKRRTD